jgi:hypothetical protein
MIALKKPQVRQTILTNFLVKSVRKEDNYLIDSKPNQKSPDIKRLPNNFNSSQDNKMNIISLKSLSVEDEDNIYNSPVKKNTGNLKKSNLCDNLKYRIVKQNT